MCDHVNMIYLQQHFNKLQNVRTVLEVGSFFVNGNGKYFIQSLGLEYVGIDLRSGPDVDLVCDITDANINNILQRAYPQYKEFDLILCMNVLEHIYDPIRALDNMKGLLKPGGYLLLVTPLVWDLHEYPHDYYRLNPDFFREYFSRNGFSILTGTFLLSIRDSKQFYPNINILPMLHPHIYNFVVTLEALAMISTEAITLQNELVEKGYIAPTGVIYDSFVDTIEAGKEIALSPRFASIQSRVHNLLKTAYIGKLLHKLCRLSSVINESWSHTYLNVIAQKGLSC